MASGLTASRIVSRTAPMKGIKAIGFAPYSATTPVLNTATGVVAMPANIGAGSIARVFVKATGNNLIETGTFDEATRTMEYVGVNNFFIPGLDDALRTQIQDNAGHLHTMFIEDYNGKIYVLGPKNGCDVVTLVTGTDLQGFTVTINSKEPALAYVMNPSLLGTYTTALMAV